ASTGPAGFSSADALPTPRTIPADIVANDRREIGSMTFSRLRKSQWAAELLLSAIILKVSSSDPGLHILILMLAGKSALVTGSSRGIGLGVARAFAEAGARVILTSEFPRHQLPEVESVLRSPGTDYIQADVSQPSEPERLVAEAWERLGRID